MSSKRGLKSPPPEVKVGQVWRDNDQRFGHDRRVKVVTLYPDGNEAWTFPHAIVENIETGKRTRVRLSRFRPTTTGYVLEEQVP